MPSADRGRDDTPGAMALLEMIHSGWMSQAIYVAARLGIAEALDYVRRFPEQCYALTFRRRP